MIRHIVLWTLKDRCFGPELDNIKNSMKQELEALNGTIEGLIELKVYTNSMSSSTADVMLESTFTDEAALKAYATNPSHTKVANTYVVPFVETRNCIDFEL